MISNNEDIKEFVDNELAERENILNSILGRSNFLRQFGDGKQQDVAQECGYPITEQLTVDTLKEFYDREPIATRVVQVLPEESWRTVPNIYESDDDRQTPFEKSWEELSLTITGQSKFRQKKGSQIWEYLKRADTLSGIGFFGVLFLGLDDNLPLDEPAETRPNQQLLFLRAFDQSNVEIVQYESDPTNPRYGMPVMYTVEFSSPESTGGIGVENVIRRIHWTRVIHIADNIGSNEVFGVPRQRPVFNRLWDLRKLYGGSAEMYWKGAFPGLSIETHPQLGATAAMNTTGLKDMIQDYQLGLQRYLALNGMSANSLSPQVVDPASHIETQIDSICVQLAIPKRIFMGSERGELASSQDKNAWNERLETRQTSYITPRIIVPFIDRLIELGVLEEPTEYYCRWPELESSSPDEKAGVALKKTDALMKYIAGDVDAVMSPSDFFTKILDLPADEAEAVLDNATDTFDQLIERRMPDVPPALPATKPS